MDHVAHYLASNKGNWRAIRSLNFVLDNPRACAVYTAYRIAEGDSHTYKTWWVTPTGVIFEDHSVSYWSLAHFKRHRAHWADDSPHRLVPVDENKIFSYWEGQDLTPDSFRARVLNAAAKEKVKEALGELNARASRNASMSRV